ncbi:pectin lyase fold/virulence factor [Filobasidium floriforme]|uniref:pectin lyase fold/virulence factor n=1 Tax=Filobasidium floriforme TaxID=5210 RepID=UPI001E8CD974|nr:pectin lyase fold/virulence factor [Filobasidium floriforme]KAH8088261.1 pectin lyase fold/virulence factor [Filobasidium floriforme]
MYVSLILSSLLASAALTSATANSTWAACQYPRAQGSQLDQCPNGTLYVSQTDPQAGFGQVSRALDSSHVILIGPGNYHEVINVTRQGPLTLLGVTSDPYDWRNNQVHVWNSSFINQTTQAVGEDNADAMVLTVSPNRNASLIGAGPAGAPLQPEFGNIDFRVYNLDFANRATVGGREFMGQTGPSGAVSVSYTNASFYGCSFFSWQDTLYVGRNGSALFYGGEVRGETDYLYGFGTAWFENVTMANRGNGGALTAWKGSTGIITDEVNTYGVYQANGRIVRAEDAPEDLNLTRSCALGRPWNNASRAVYLNTYMSDIVLPQGFIEWSAKEPRIVPGLTEFVEVGSYGPGFQLEQRNQSVGEVANGSAYTVESVFGGMPAWVDLGTVVFGKGSSASS